MGGKNYLGQFKQQRSSTFANIKQQWSSNCYIKVPCQTRHVKPLAIKSVLDLTRGNTNLLLCAIIIELRTEIVDSFNRLISNEDLLALKPFNLDSKKLRWLYDEVSGSILQRQKKKVKRLQPKPKAWVDLRLNGLAQWEDLMCCHATLDCKVSF